MAVRVERRMFTSAPWGLLAATLLTAGIGIYNLVSASRPPNHPLWGAQSAYLAIGLLAVVGVAAFDYRFIQRMAVPIYLLNIGALVALKFFGHTAKGAESWFVLGPLRVQPAEFMKIGMVLMYARFFNDDYRPGKEGHYGFLRLAIPVLIGLVPILLVLVQPDLGTALMMVFTAATLILFARVRWTVLVAIGVALVFGTGVLWNDYVRVQSEPKFTVVRHHLKKHQDGRIAGWLEPQTDLKGTNYHAMQSKIAVGSGGMTGKGWKDGTQTGLRYLPEQHTDFIFSVWAEEQGFLRCLLLLLLYAVILLGSLGVAYGARDRFGAFVAVGIAAMIFWQVFENIGMVTGLLPITGITLPLMSYGGSSMLSVMIGIGLLVNIGMRRYIF
ncbi:MAG: Rod shape-determining protein RodA [Myxococcaceae bacterium]|nr:Rod shape-determining protein RodA [Myxococcaceae bacterium]